MLHASCAHSTIWFVLDFLLVLVFVTSISASHQVLELQDTVEQEFKELAKAAEAEVEAIKEGAVELKNSFLGIDNSQWKAPDTQDALRKLEEKLK